VLLGEQPQAAEPELRRRTHDEPVSIAYRAPPKGGLAYRLVVEYSGEHESAAEPGRQSVPPAHETHLLELEYRELPAGGRDDVLLFALDALHYRLAQDAPKAEREIELGDDRLRIREGSEIVTDLRGAQPKEDLTPRKLLGQIIGSARVDPAGSLSGLQPRGAPVARRFVAELPVARALAYARPAFPDQPVRPGARWSSSRFPVGPAGSLGLALALDYTLTGFQDVDGVPCAWILFSAGHDGERVRSAAGFDFDRVVASLRGEAFVELESAQLRLLRLDDEIRAVYTIGAPPAPVRTHRLRHRSQLRLERVTSGLPGAGEASWADGSPRFGPR
jgi:hypothetical protein